jgi:hypothetical protein
MPDFVGLSRLPPNNTDAEQAVLGIVLIEGTSVLPKLAGALEVNDFYLESHRIVYDTMLSMAAANVPVDTITLSERLRAQGQLEQVGGAVLLANLQITATVGVHLTHYIEIVRAHALRRSLIQEASRRIGEAFDAAVPAAEILDGLRLSIDDLAKRALASEALFTAYAAEDLLALDLQPPTFHIDGWIPTKGLSFIVGDSEAGKSWFMLYLALCIATGTPVLGKLPVTQCPVLILSEENGIIEDKRRLELTARGMGFDLAKVPLYIASETSFSFDDTARYAALRAFLTDKAIRLAFIDSFIRVHRREEKDAGQMNALYLDRMRPLIRDGVDLILLHHRRKLPAGIHQGQAQQATGENDDIRGSGDLRAAAHAVIFLRTLSETNAMKAVVVRHNKARGFKKQSPFVFGIADSDVGISITWEGRPEDVLDKSGACREAVLAFAKDRIGGFYRPDVVAALKGKYSRKVIDPMLKLLSDRGYPLKFDQHGKKAFYVYVEAGPEPGDTNGADETDVPF